MSARFTSKIRSFIASSFIDTFGIAQIQYWQQNTLYSEGDVVRNGNFEYICKNTGTSGVIPPTHISGTESDGSINWIFIRQISINNIFYKNTYLGLGKSDQWADEENPDNPSANDDEDPLVFNNLKTLIHLNQNNVRIGCRHYKWEVGSTYSQYDNKKDPIAVLGSRAYSNPFYAITDTNDIFICINNNNNSASTEKPTNTGLLPFLLADGYIWKYIGSMEINSTFFKTNEFFPVSFRNYNDSSSQYSVQQAAIPKSLSTFKILRSIGTFTGDMTTTLMGGSPVTPATAIAIKNVNNTLRQVIVSPSAQGVGYDLNSRVIALVRKSDSVGSNGAVGNITISGGVITNITVGNAGTGYTGGAIIIINDRDGIPTSEAVVDVIISGVDNSIQQFDIINGGSGYSDNIEAYIIPGNAGAIAEGIFAPKNGHGHNAIIETGANAVIINERISSSGNYLLVGENNAIRQISILTNVVVKDSLEYADELLYIGPDHPNYGDNILNEIDSNKGYILYINNIKKIVRSERTRRRYFDCSDILRIGKTHVKIYI